MLVIAVAVFASITAPLVMVYVTSRQRRSEKAQDYARQDAVAAQAREAARLLSARQDDAARQAEEVARLLLAAQTKTTKDTAEVARLAAAEATGPGGLLDITLSYPNGNRKTVMLSGVPRVGDYIRASIDPNSPSLLVEHVLWVDRSDVALPPYIILSVFPRAN